MPREYFGCWNRTSDDLRNTETASEQTSRFSKESDAHNCGDPPSSEDGWCGTNRLQSSSLCLSRSPTPVPLAHRPRWFFDPVGAIFLRSIWGRVPSLFAAARRLGSFSQYMRARTRALRSRTMKHAPLCSMSHGIGHDSDLGVYYETIAISREPCNWLPWTPTVCLSIATTASSLDQP
jgi:hypothetical protein